MTEVSVETCFANLRVLSFSLKLLFYCPILIIQALMIHICDNKNKSYFVSATKLFSFKFCHETPVRIEFVSLQSTNLCACHAHEHHN